MNTCQVLSQLRVVARSEGSAERFDREVWSAELSPLLNLWKKLNQVREQPVHSQVREGHGENDSFNSYVYIVCLVSQ